MMNVPFHTDTLVIKDTTKTSPIKVCMHVLTTARTDVRVIRAASALTNAGFTVSVVDVASDCPHHIENVDGIDIST